MTKRFSPHGIPLRLAILLLPLMLGLLVTTRVIGWAQFQARAVEYDGQVAELAVAGPPVPELVVEIERKRPVIAVSREGGERRALPKENQIADLVPESYRPLVLTTAARHGLDPRLLASVIMVETRFDRTTVGSHGEVGLMQIMAETGAWLARYARVASYDLRDDETSLDLGAIYLAINLREHGTIERALAVYNGGPRAADGWATNIYVERVMSYYRR